MLLSHELCEAVLSYQPNTTPASPLLLLLLPPRSPELLSHELCEAVLSYQPNTTPASPAIYASPTGVHRSSPRGPSLTPTTPRPSLASFTPGPSVLLSRGLRVKAAAVLGVLHPHVQAASGRASYSSTGLVAKLRKLVLKAHTGQVCVCVLRG